MESVSNYIKNLNYGNYLENTVKRLYNRKGIRERNMFDIEAELKKLPGKPRCIYYA